MGQGGQVFGGQTGLIGGRLGAANVAKRTPMPDWDARQYLKFEDDRTRPPRDLLAQVPLSRARLVIDLGCGPGNSTELLVARYPDAEVIGVDSSVNMLRQARARLPRRTFIQADTASWTPEEPADLLFSNSAFQWVPRQQNVLLRLVQTLPQGGVLAVQIPDIGEIPALVLLREVAGRGPWARNPAVAEAARRDVPKPETYYDLLRPMCGHVDIWHTIYSHVLAGPEAIVEWLKGSALQPFLSALEPQMIDDFLAAYTVQIDRHHSKRIDGQVLLKLPRLFIVATQ
jgi:trans-aconitate 2-methyltransferase